MNSQHKIDNKIIKPFLIDIKICIIEVYIINIILVESEILT